MKYRPDIDGLRGVAILPVVFFHAGFESFSGGYVGVDVFFVISGYLITSLIAQEMQQTRFSIIVFYERRIRRIFPALFAVILGCALIAPTIVSSVDLKAFDRSVLATALFVSNALFWSEADYFDTPAESKPLLHTWSLAVEEQFYIIYPLFLLFIHRIAGRKWRFVLMAAAAISLIASIQVTFNDDASAAFYLAPFRAWELLLGALAALNVFPGIRSRALREALSLAGMGMIVSATIVYSEHTLFPGLSALLPCVGTVLLIHTGNGASSVLNRALSWKPLVFVGLISYSLYLWHWPVLVFAKQLLLRQLTDSEVTAAISLSFLLAGLSWRFIERPFRKRGHAEGGSRKVFAGGVIATSLAVYWATGQVQETPFFPGSTFTPPFIAGREHYRADNCFLNEQQTYSDWGSKYSCVTKGRTSVTVLLWGDSFAAHYVPGIVNSKSGRDHGLVQYTARSCPPILGTRVSWAQNCHDVNEHIVDILDRHPVDVVVIAARWERYWSGPANRHALEDTIRFLKDRKLSVILIGQGPSFDFHNPAEYVHRTGDRVAPSKNFASLNLELSQVPGYDRFFDPVAHLCSRLLCPLQEGKEFLYLDSGHYSTYGSTYVSEKLLQTIGDLVKNDERHRRGDLGMSD